MQYGFDSVAVASLQAMPGFLQVFGFKDSTSPLGFGICATELVSSRLKAWTVGTATSLGCLLASIISFCTPYFINPEDLNWGAKYGYVWAASNFLCVVFLFFLVLEMKGRALEELDEIFGAGTPARKFKQFKCRIIEEVMHNLNIKGAAHAKPGEIYTEGFESNA